MTLVASAVVAIIVAATLALSNSTERQRDASRAASAAEVLALAAVLGTDLGALAEEYGVERYEVTLTADGVTVEVWSDDSVARASAVDHRRTLTTSE